MPEPRTVPLCGNSIGTDRRFLAAYLPDIEEYLHYRSVDVSSIKELVRRWYPDVLAQRGWKAGTHRALDDIRESLAELRLYRELVFSSPELVRERLTIRNARSRRAVGASDDARSSRHLVRRSGGHRRPRRPRSRNRSRTRSSCAWPVARSTAPTRCSDRAVTPIPRAAQVRRSWGSSSPARWPRSEHA